MTASPREKPFDFFAFVISFTSVSTFAALPSSLPLWGRGTTEVVDEENTA